MSIPEASSNKNSRMKSNHPVCIEKKSDDNKLKEKDGIVDSETDEIINIRQRAKDFIE